MYSTLKRILDITVAITLAPVALLLVACAAIAIGAESRGPVIFAQRRVGRHGREFICYKLRTMYIDTPQAASHEISRSAVTRVGSALRKLKVDEIPQLWNVLVGDMSLVGPRPSLPTQTELIESRRALGVLQLPPGITGLAQVRGVDMSNPQVLARVDAEYGAHLSIRTDIALMFQTLSGRGRGDRVGA